MTATPSKPADVWAAMVADDNPLPVWMAVDLLQTEMEWDQALRLIHIAAAEWLEDHRDDKLRGSFISMWIREGELDKAQRQVNGALKGNRLRWTYRYYTHYGQIAINLLRQLVQR